MNLLILLYLLILAPKLLWDRVIKGKRHPGFLQRIGFSIPQTTKPVIWIHAISVGEIKAAQPLFLALRKENPDATFLITTTTATGQMEAKRSLSQADLFGYFPLDLSWVVRRWVKKLNPKHFILIESDFWPNLLRALRKNGTQISLVSGKVSERSFNRFLKLSFFSKRLFSHFDQICVQNEQHKSRFVKLVPDPTKVHVTGNLKLDIEPQEVKTVLNIKRPCIVISCTHAPEEEQLLDALIGGDWSIILAPRHPERFQEVAELLQKKQIPFSRWENREEIQKVLLVDEMGQLPACYQISQLAIVGGSFVNHIGGHNVLEPCLYGTPVFFGPHMHGQKEFAKRALDSGAGKQVTLKELRKIVDMFFSQPKIEAEMRFAASRVSSDGRGVTEKTLSFLGY